MQDLGIRVLFMGNNFIRLLGGLWITIKISLMAVLLSVFLGTLLGMVMTLKNPDVSQRFIWNLSGSCPSWYYCSLFTLE